MSLLSADTYYVMKGSVCSINCFNQQEAIVIGVLSDKVTKEKARSLSVVYMLDCFSGTFQPFD